MLKVMTIVGTRPELIKMSRVICEFDMHTKHVLVHTGQNHDYELNQIFFDDLEIRKPDYFLEAVGKNVAKTLAKIIEKTDEVFQIEKPDALMLYGDTNSCLAVIPAKRRKIPVFHMEAGNRCFDQRVPEELNRKIVDHLSDINFVLSEHARRYLTSEGIRPETIIKTGSHMREILDHYALKIGQSSILEKMGLKKGKYFVVSVHREENVDVETNLKEILDTLNDLAEIYDLPIIVSTHPRTQIRLYNLKDSQSYSEKIKFLKPFGFCDYIKLQMESLCVISDSGTISEESSLLSFPAVTIRNTHERPEVNDFGTLILTGLKKENVLDSVRVVIEQRKRGLQLIEPVIDYEIPNVSAKILRIVLGYTDYINKNVWKKTL